MRDTKANFSICGKMLSSRHNPIFQTFFFFSFHFQLQFFCKNPFPLYTNLVKIQFNARPFYEEKHEKTLKEMTIYAPYENLSG